MAFLEIVYRCSADGKGESLDLPCRHPGGELGKG